MVNRSGEEVAFSSEEKWVEIRSIAFTSDGERVIGSRDPMGSWLDCFGQAAVWDWRTGRLERSIDTEADGAVLSPRGDLLVSVPRSFVKGSQVAKVWDWATGQHLRTLGHSGSVTDAAFSPDGSRLATASRDGTVQIWDPYADAPEQLVLQRHLGSVDSVSFSPDGTRLATVSVDGTVCVWALDLDELVDVAERGLTRTLTDNECLQYLHTEHCP